MPKKKSKWTNEPKVVGWYWWRKDMTRTPTDVVFITHEDLVNQKECLYGLWYFIEAPK